MSGSRTNSSKPKAKNGARKEVTQLEQRQYRHQFLESKMSEHKSWVDHDVHDLGDMSKHPPNNFVKGRWALTVKRDTDGSFSHVRLVGYWEAFRISKNLISKLISYQCLGTGQLASVANTVQSLLPMFTVRVCSRRTNKRRC